MPPIARAGQQHVAKDVAAHGEDDASHDFDLRSGRSMTACDRFSCLSGATRDTFLRPAPRPARVPEFQGAMRSDGRKSLTFRGI